MRLALVIALAPDRRSGRVLSDILPADQAVAAVKAAIDANRMLEGFPNLEAVALDSCLRRHRFKADASVIPEEGGPEQPQQSLIVVELGEGDGRVVINVTTEEEADFLRKLADSAGGAEKKILELTEQLKRETEYKAEVNQRIATLEADLKAAREGSASASLTLEPVLLPGTSEPGSGGKAKRAASS
jgi:hypothetical protein